jgi:hypothetical protein
MTGYTLCTGPFAPNLLVTVPDSGHVFVQRAELVLFSEAVSQGH